MTPKISLAALVVMAVSSYSIAQESELKTIDSNADGKVSLSEFKTYVEGKLPEFEQLDEFCKKVDSDGNGEISKEEFDSRMEKLAELMQDRDAPEQEMEKAEENAAEGDREQVDLKSAEAAFAKISENIQQGEWSAIPDLMTKEACDDFCAEMTIGAIGFANAEMPMEIPGLSETKDSIQEVIEVYGLDKLDIDTSSMFRMSIEIDGDGDAEESGDAEPVDPKTKQAKQKATVLEALDKDGDRWEIIGAIWKASSDSPMMMSPVTWAVKQSELDDKVCYLTVNAKPPEMAEQGGVQIQVMAPPSIIRMEKNDDDVWKYAGRDPERTQKAMEKFMKEMQQNRGGFDRTDF